MERRLEQVIRYAAPCSISVWLSTERSSINTGHPLRIVFAGTPSFAVIILDKLRSSDHPIVAVLHTP